MPHSQKASSPLSSKLQIENLRLSLIKEHGSSRGEASPYTDLTPHSHSQFELVYCSAGQITIHSEGQAFSLKPWDAALVPPGILHQTKSEREDTVWSALVFTCNCSEKEVSSASLFGRLSPFLKDRRIKTYRHLPKQYCSYLQSLMHEEFPNPYLPGVYLFQVLLLLGLPNQSPRRHTNDGFPDIRLPMRLDDIIHTRYTENLKLKEVAEQLFLSERHLSRIVKKQYGKTFHKLILEKRLAAAQRLLEIGEMSLSQISAAVGFPSVAVFKKEYLRCYGILPRTQGKC